MNTKRTDVHREEVFNPEDYAFVRSYDTRPPLISPAEKGYTKVLAAWRKEQEELRTLMKQSGVNIHPGLNRCDHCGAVFNYGCVICHIPTGKFLTVGTTCAVERFELTQAEWERKRMEKRRKIQKARRSKASKHLALRHSYPDAIRYMNKYRKHGFIGNVRDSFKATGIITDKQAETVITVGKKLDVGKQQAEAEKALLVPIPTVVASGNRTQLKGKVLSLKSRIGAYGYETKMLVLDDRGFKIYGTAPKQLLDVDSEKSLRGRRVVFEAVVQVSKDDPKFGFFSRPTKAGFLEPETVSD